MAFSSEKVSMKKMREQVPPSPFEYNSDISA